MDAENMMKDIPEHVLTHKGCPRCGGTRVIRFRTGNMETPIECHYYGATYKLRERMLAELAMEKE